MAKKKDKKLRISLKVKRVFLLLFSIGVMGLSTGLFLLYGPYDKLRNTLITTAMTTMSHQYLARWFYTDEYINKVGKSSDWTVEINGKAVDLALYNVNGYNYVDEEALNKVLS